MMSLCVCVRGLMTCGVGSSVWSGVQSVPAWSSVADDEFTSPSMRFTSPYVNVAALNQPSSLASSAWLSSPSYHRDTMMNIRDALSADDINTDNINIRTPSSAWFERGNPALMSSFRNIDVPASSIMMTDAQGMYMCTRVFA